MWHLHCGSVLMHMAGFGCLLFQFAILSACNVWQMLHKGDDVPKCFIIVCCAERRHSRHSDAVLHNPEQARVVPIASSLREVWSPRVQSSTRSVSHSPRRTVTTNAHGGEFFKTLTDLLVGESLRGRNAGRPHRYRAPHRRVKDPFAHCTVRLNCSDVECAAQNEEQAAKYCSAKNRN